MEKITAKRIGKRINALLAEKGMMQKELAALLQVPPNTISYFAKGDRTPNSEQLLKIGESLNVSVDYILGLSEISSRDESVQGINKKLGLSEKAIENIIKIQQCDSKMIWCLNCLLENPEFNDMIWSILRADESRVCKLDQLKDQCGFPSGSNDFDDALNTLATASSEYTIIRREDACNFYIQEAQYHLREVVKKIIEQEGENNATK